ncbi:MAG: methyltransferase domain-containing protein [Acidobacteria bacterium]|nr:methyltransferase domain-containing protein [Acidobacteriota bacterium]
MSDSLSRYYDAYDEHERLKLPAVGQLEYTRTIGLLTRRLPKAPGVVLDVGGGTGHYAECLSRQGYEVHLLDAVAKHVEAAAKRPGIASAQLGDARRLPWPDNFADIVLLMGPLYHLERAVDRFIALREAERVLKPGGWVAVAAISRFASLLDGLTRTRLDDPVFQAILTDDLEHGVHTNPTDNPEYFTTAYFHLPEELEVEITGAGFQHVELFAVEGPVWTASDFDQRWADPEKRLFLLETLERVEREPSLMGATAHLMAFAHKA